MKRIGILLFFLGGGILLALGIAELTGLNLAVAGGISITAALLTLIMIDREPEADPKAATIIRLTRPARLGSKRGSRRRKVDTSRRKMAG